MTFDLPLGVTLKEIRDRQVSIVLDLRERGYSFGALASIFAVSSQSLAQYVRRKGSTPRVSAKLADGNANMIEAIHWAVMRPSETLSRIVSSTTIAAYQSIFQANDAETIAYRRLGSDGMTHDRFVALSAILHDIYRADLSVSIGRLRQIAGRYYMYRLSSQQIVHADKDGNPRFDDMIVKSLMHIGKTDGGNDFVDFEHYHQDRQFDPKNDEPTRTTGIGLFSQENMFFLGVTEKDAGPSSFALRAPRNDSFNRLLGFTSTTNFEKAIMGTRIVLIRDDTASVDKIGRIFVTDFDAEREKFQKELLRQPDYKYVADSMSLMSKTIVRKKGAP